MDKKRIFSGVQASGQLTLGNYIGAIKNWVKLQDEYSCIYSVVDLHSITVPQLPQQLRARSMEILKMLMACGIDTSKHLLFFQSHVSKHAELAWVLNCYTYMGELSRMTQFKDKSQNAGQSIGAGLFTYPVLMAADILLYQADLVPVGQDQKQHMELARTLAERFNGQYGNVFTVPEPYIPKQGARIMSLQEPSAKMSKSATNENSYIALLDPSDVIIKKFKRAVTDSKSAVDFDDLSVGVENLINIYCAVTGRSLPQARELFEGKGYGEFKAAVGDAVADCLAPIQQRFNELGSNMDYVESVYKNSAQTAEDIAERTLRKVYKKVGFVEKNK